MRQSTNLSSRNEIERLISNWFQTTLQDLPNAFYGCDNMTNERVVTFKLEGNDLSQLLLLNSNPNNLILRLHLGIRELNFSRVPDDPLFAPIIQGYNTNTNPTELNNCIQMTWDPNPPILSLLSPVIPSVKITRAVSNLLIAGWNELPSQEIGSIFEGVSNGKAQRARFYTFGETDSWEIRQFVQTQGLENCILFMHIGVLNGTEISQPFRFHPILEIYADNETTGPTSLYFEFSSPCPPACENVPTES